MIKSERQKLLKKYLQGNPFLTDEDLAQILGVSIQTIRLDRFELNIPELRERIVKVAKGIYGQVRTLGGDELVGKLIDLKMEEEGFSILTVSKEMTYEKSKVARGNYLFEQANSLAVALVDADIALTGTAKISFKRPVFRDEKIIARAIVRRKKGNKYIIRVRSTVEGETVFEGKFLIFSFNREGVALS